MYKLRYLFYLTVVEFISDWYSLHKVSAKTPEEMRSTFKSINRLKGILRTELEREEYENETV